MTEEEQNIKCPICGNMNSPETEKCTVCWTRLSVDSETNEMTVSSPKPQGDIYEIIDLEDPMTRKRLEELTMIPGVSKKKALYLYRSGITSLEEFVEKAFHGDRRGVNYSRMVANKIILSSMKGEETASKVTCPSCDSETDADSDTCKICGKPMETINVEEVSRELGEVANTYLEELGQDDDFAALPEDMRMQMAAALEDEDGGVGDVGQALEMLGEDFKELGIDVAEPGGGEPENDEPGEGMADAVAAESGGQPKKKSVDPEKRRKVYIKKIKEWHEAGYDVSGLHDLVEADVETFKKAAKEMIKKGKVNK